MHDLLVKKLTIFVLPPNFCNNNNNKETKFQKIFLHGIKKKRAKLVLGFNIRLNLKHIIFFLLLRAVLFAFI